MTKEILLIDFGSVFWTAWHSSANEEISAAHDRAVRQVRHAIDGFEFVAVCCDSPKSFRREKHPTYKANRADKEAAALDQLRSTRATLEADGLLCWEADGFEADDLIATATHEALARDLQVSILSSDKDLLQLVNDRVSVRSLKTGVTFRAAEVEAKFGVPPAQMRDWLALVGDKSDNVQGVPGIGEKRASDLLKRFASIDGLLEAMAKNETISTPAITDALYDNRDVLLTARELVTLRGDVPINFEQVFSKRDVRPLVEAEWEDAASPPAPSKPVPTAPQVDPLPPAAEPLKKATTAIVKAGALQGWTLALEPSDTPSAFTLAKHLFNSRLYSNFPSAEAVFAVILRGRSLGLDATTSLANFHVVEGKPTMSATLIVGLVHSSGLADHFDLLESTDEQATWTTKRKDSGQETAMTFTIRDAANAGLVTFRDGEFFGVSKSGKPSNWDKYRRAMLRHRCAVELARAVFADVVAGLFTPDEISDGRVIEASFDEAAP